MFCVAVKADGGVASAAAYGFKYGGLLRDVEGTVATLGAEIGGLTAEKGSEAEGVKVANGNRCVKLTEPLLLGAVLVGFVWMMYLLIRSLEAIYLLDGLRATATVMLSILLLYVAFIFPWQVIYHLGIRALTGM